MVDCKGAFSPGAHSQRLGRFTRGRMSESALCRSCLKVDFGCLFGGFGSNEGSSKAMAFPVGRFLLFCCC